MAGKLLLLLMAGSLLLGSCGDESSGKWTLFVYQIKEKSISVRDGKTVRFAKQFKVLGVYDKLNLCIGRAAMHARNMFDASNWGYTCGLNCAAGAASKSVNCAKINKGRMKDLAP